MGHYAWIILGSHNSFNIMVNNVNVTNDETRDGELGMQPSILQKWHNTVCAKHVWNKQCGEPQLPVWIFVRFSRRHPQAKTKSQIKQGVPWAKTARHSEMSKTSTSLSWMLEWLSRNEHEPKCDGNLSLSTFPSAQKSVSSLTVEYTENNKTKASLPNAYMQEI